MIKTSASEAGHFEFKNQLAGESHNLFGLGFLTIKRGAGGGGQQYLPQWVGVGINYFMYFL